VITPALDAAHNAGYVHGVLVGGFAGLLLGLAVGLAIVVVRIIQEERRPPVFTTYEDWLEAKQSVEEGWV
jgi:hypothetical protein